MKGPTGASPAEVRKSVEWYRQIIKFHVVTLANTRVKCHSLGHWVLPAVLIYWQIFPIDGSTSRHEHVVTSYTHRWHYLVPDVNTSWQHCLQGLVLPPDAPRIWHHLPVSDMCCCQHPHNILTVNSLFPGRCDYNLELVIFKLISRIWTFPAKFSSGECWKILVIIKQHWFR